MNWAELDAIPWAKRRGAYGSAAGVPVHLKLLVAESAQSREDAYDYFYSSVLHQGSVYEVAADVIPFVLELIRDLTTPDRSKLIQLVSDFVDGGSWHQAHEHFSLMAERRKTREYQENKATELKSIDLIRARALSGIELYVACLRDIDVDVRLAATTLAARLPEICEHANVPLRELAETDPSSVVRANALTAMCALELIGESEIIGWKDGTKLVQTAIALTRHLLWPDPPQATSQLLLEALVDSALRQELEAVPLLGVSLDVIGRALSRCAEPLRHQALIRACELLEQRTSSWLDEWEASGLLSIAFAGSAASEGPLTTLQARAVAVVAQKAWQGSRTIANLVHVLGAFGLPSTPDAMTALLGEELLPRRHGHPRAMARPWWKLWW